MSTDTFAAIWAARENEETNENDILERILGCASSGRERRSVAQTEGSAGIGFDDRRNNVRFPEGFTVFRNYKGNRYEAVASDGRWHRKDTGKSFASLNQLSLSITDVSENVWVNWSYRNKNGHVNMISALRS
ncbi:MAG: hypothetical protein AAF205_04095 [Pseudomonadota bacterium]